MNDTEVSMFDALPRHTLIAHTKALEAAGIALSLVTGVKPKRSRSSTRFVP